MTALSARDGWDALRRRFAGESLARIMTACGWEAGAGERAASGPGEWGDGGIAPYGSILLRTEDGSRQLRVGPVELLWQGAPLNGAPPDWPRAVSPDAARFFLTSRPLDAPVSLDLDLAARRDENNPYYFACYIQRRLGTVLSRQPPEGSAAPEALTGAGRALALAAGRFPAAVRRAAEGCDPYFVNRYAVELAGEVRRFLRACPPAGEARPLLAAAETALGNALRLLRAKPDAA